jgi:hypothetical protein
MIARDLVSKLLAAGLSAGLFLIWWPQHHPTTGLTSLIVRGALWTLSFELLLLAFAPLERLVTRALRERLAVRRRIAVPPRAQIGGACVLACAGAALPLALLAGAHAPRAARPAPPTPRKVVVVKHLRQKVVVREVVTVPAAAVAHPAPPVVARPAAPAKVRAKPKARAAAPKPAAVTTPVPAPATTTPAVTTTTTPAAPVTSP